MQNHRMTQFTLSCSSIVCLLIARTVDGISPGWLLSPCFSRTFHQVVESTSPPLESGWTSAAVQPVAEQFQREGHKNARRCHGILLEASRYAGKEPQHAEERRPPPTARWAPRHSHADERALTLLSTRSLRPAGHLLSTRSQGNLEAFPEQGTSGNTPEVRKGSEAVNDKTGGGVPGHPKQAEAQLGTHSGPLDSSPRPLTGPALRPHLLTGPILS